MLRGRRRLVAVAVVLVVLGAGLAGWRLAAGGDTALRNPQAVKAVRLYESALGRGNAAAACAALAPPMQAAVTKAASAYGRFTCTEVMSRLLGTLGAKARATIAAASITVIAQTPDTVRVKVAFGTGKAPAEMLVLRSGNGWLVGPTVTGSPR
jgi:hypothetical protein